MLPKPLKVSVKQRRLLPKEATQSEASAKKVLVKEGIYTEAGELSKNYRP